MGDPTHVAVVGGGFAGVACARRLAAHRSAADRRVRVTLLDRLGYHQFQPLLYQVATAELSHHDVAFDLKETFRHHDSVDVRTAEVAALDPQERTLTLTDDSVLTADTIVLTAGAQPNFFGTPGADRYAYPLYGLTDADRLRRRVLTLFRDAAAAPEPAEHGALTFVVVGAGPTGVETAGALAELVHEVIPMVYGQQAAASAQVILVDRGPCVLPTFSAASQAYATQQLHERGVQLRLSTPVEEVGSDYVRFGDATTLAATTLAATTLADATPADATLLPTHLVVWAGGEKAAPLAAAAGLPQGQGGRLDVQPDLSVAGHPDIFAVGDVANIPYRVNVREEFSGFLPQLGSVATQAGDWVARTIIADLDGQGGPGGGAGGPGGGARRPFTYHDKGIMAMVGRKAAVAEIGEHRHELVGRFAFAAWLGVHAELLANAGAEVHAFVTWAQEYYLRPHHRDARLLDPDQSDEPAIDWGHGPGHRTPG